MPRFFIPKEDIFENEIWIKNENAHHILRVLRMNIGDLLTLCDYFNTEYEAVLSEICGSGEDLVLKAQIQKTITGKNEPPYDATLYMALPKGDKMEWIIQKSVELGVKRIVPFSSERTVLKLDAEGKRKKQQRWQKIADAAAGQCGRGILPEVALPVSYKEALQEVSNEQVLPFLCYEKEEETTVKNFLQQHPQARSFAFFIGAEGGFSEKEVEEALHQNIKTVSLGNRILRCESAPLYLLSCLSFFFEL